MSENEKLRAVDAFSKRDLKRPISDRAKRVSNSWKLLLTSLVLTVVVVVVSLLLTGIAAVITALTVAILAGMFQVLGVISASGREPDANMVRMQIIQAQSLHEILDRMRQQVEAAYETGSAEDRKRALGAVSAGFTPLQHMAVSNAFAWGLIRPDLEEETAEDE